MIQKALVMASNALKHQLAPAQRVAIGTGAEASAFFSSDHVSVQYASSSGLAGGPI